MHESSSKVLNVCSTTKPAYQIIPPSVNVTEHYMSRINFMRLNEEWKIGGQIKARWKKKNKSVMNREKFINKLPQSNTFGWKASDGDEDEELTAVVDEFWWWLQKN